MANNLLDLASVVLTPTGYDTNKILCVKPSNATGDFNFVRDTEATRINQNGLIETIGKNLPRINYDGNCGHWLFENQATNSLRYSSDYTNASWVKRETTIEAASLTLPDGSTNGYKLFANTTPSVNHWLEKIYYTPALPGEDSTISLFVKSAGSDYIQIAASSGFAVKYQNFNISNGTIASGDALNSSITDFGNGWYRISVSEKVIGNNARYLIVPILIDDIRNPQFSGNVNQDGVYIWGAMQEKNPFSTSYVPTTSSFATRNQDLCNNGAMGPGLISSTEGVLYAEIAKNTKLNQEQVSISLSNGDPNNRIMLYFPIENQAIICQVRVNGITQFSANYNLGPLATNFNKIAISYKENNFSFWVNGIQVAASTNGVLPVGLNRLSFDVGANLNTFFGKTKCVAVWQELLTNSQLQNLTQ